MSAAPSLFSAQLSIKVGALACRMRSLLRRLGRAAAMEPTGLWRKSNEPKRGLAFASETAREVSYRPLS